MKNPFLSNSYCCLFFIAHLFFATNTTQAQWIQKGNYLTNPQIIRTSFGNAVSISADGKTAFIGGYVDLNNKGASWAYTNTGTSFDGTGYSQVGPKMVSSDYTDYAEQGYSVDISADGQVAVVGGPGDNNFLGAAWIYTFNGSVFEQAGNKLVGTGSVDMSQQGTSVCISGDGKTVLVGGEHDNGSIGAVWIYTFNGTNFVQFGNKIVCTGNIRFSLQGSSVSISDDAKTLIIGGQGDNDYIGATWIFTFNGSNYVQLGNKLVGSGAIGVTGQGYSVDISADAKSVIIGGYYDNYGIGAAWIFTFNGNSFVQLGDKLVGSNAIGKANQGRSVSISSDGRSAVVGGALDNNGTGAAWTYIYNGSTFVEVNKIVGSGISGNQLQGQSVSISGDGKIILVGGSDADVDGAVWVFENPDPTCAPPVIHSITTFPGVCEGSDLVLSLTVTGFPSLFNYQWYQDNISIPGANASLLTLPGINSTSTGIYTCMISNACGSITSDGINLVVNPVVTISGSVIPGPVCKGKPVTITGSGSANIFISNGTLGTGFVPTASSIYTLQDTTYQCALPAVVTVTVLTLPSLSFSGNTSICPGSSASLTVLGAFSYFWSTGSSSENIVVMPEVSTTYQVTGTGFNACTITSSVTVNVTTLVSIPIIGNASVCIGDSVHLSVNHLESVTWSTLDRDTSVSFVPEGNMLVTLSGVTDQGCQGQGFITVTVNSLPAVSLDLSGINQLCNTVGSVALAGGLPATKGIYLYKGDSVRILDVSVPGDYKITYYYKNTYGCVNTATGIFSISLCTVPGPCDLVQPPCTCPGYTCPPPFKIYNAFTPNQDGLNDTWVIDSLPADNHIAILDKWGNQVFQADNYNNTWNGKKDQHDLPAGVYYFIVDIGQNKRRFAGTVSIIR